MWKCEHNAFMGPLAETCFNKAQFVIVVLNKRDSINTPRYLCMWHTAKALETNVNKLGWEVNIKPLS